MKTWTQLELEDSIDVQEIAKLLHACRLKRDRTLSPTWNGLTEQHKAALENAAAVALRSLDDVWDDIATERHANGVDSYQLVLAGLQPLTPAEQQRVIDAANAQDAWRWVRESPVPYHVCPTCWPTHKRDDVDVVTIGPDMHPRVFCQVCSVRVDGSRLEVE